MTTFLSMDGTAINLSQILYWQDYPTSDLDTDAFLMIYFSNNRVRLELKGDQRDNFLAWMHGNHPEEGFRVTEFQHREL